MNISIKLDEDNHVWIVKNLDNEDEQNQFNIDLWKFLDILAFVYGKYSDEYERAQLIKDTIYKDTIRRFINGN